VSYVVWLFRTGRREPYGQNIAREATSPRM